MSPDWKHESALAAKLQDSEVPVIDLQIQRYKTCTTKQVQTVANSEESIRRWKGNSGWIANGLAIASAAVLGGALVSGYASDGGFTDDYQPGSPLGDRSGWGATNGAGKAVIVGGIGTATIGAFALVHNFWARDSRRSLGEVAEETELESVRCEEGPAKGLHVTVATDSGSALFDGRTDELGHVTFPDKHSFLITYAPPYQVSVDGREEQSLAKDFASAHAQLIEQRNERVAQAVAVRVNANGTNLFTV